MAYVRKCGLSGIKKLGNLFPPNHINNTTIEFSSCKDEVCSGDYQKSRRNRSKSKIWYAKNPMVFSSLLNFMKPKIVQHFLHLSMAENVRHVVTKPT